MEFIKEFVIVSVILGVIDLIWLKFVFKQPWSNMISTIQLEPMEVKLIYALPVYILMTLAIVIYVLPNITTEHILKDSIKYGGLLGIIIYGVFDLTNMVLFSKYDMKLGLMDIAWGGFLCTLVTYVTKNVLLYLKHLI